ncbi:MAG: hypothetical protein WD649_00280 [Thermoleophilaceae bacterium]
MNTTETILLILLVAVPYSIWRQMKVGEVSPGGLVKLPLLYIAVGVFGFGITDLDIDGGAGADLYLLASVAVAIGFGVWRGNKVDVWRNESGDGWLMQGNRTTLTLWAAMILTKVVMGTVAGFTDIYPGEAPGEIFVFIGVSFAIQNVIVAQRTLWRDTPPREAVQSRVGEVQSQMQSQRPANARTE